LIRYVGQEGSQKRYPSIVGRWKWVERQHKSKNLSPKPKRMYQRPTGSLLWGQLASKLKLKGLLKISKKKERRKKKKTTKILYSILWQKIFIKIKESKKNYLFEFHHAFVLIRHLGVWSNSVKARLNACIVLSNFSCSQLVVFCITITWLVWNVMSKSLCT